MKKLIIICLFAAFSAVNVAAAIPAEVVKVMHKSSAAMESSNGLSMDMNVNINMLIISMDMSIELREKGNKSLMQMSTSVRGKEIKSEKGCDGVVAWEYKSIPTRDDTLVISKPKIFGSNNEYTIDYDIYEEYKTAKMKEKDGNYEITFTDPKNDDTPKKTVLKFRKKDYMPVEMETKESGVTMTITFSNIKFGVDDSVFVFDESRYKGATIIRQ